MGSLKKLWGWYPAGNEWVKLQVDSTGKVLLSSIQTKARVHLSANQINIPNKTVTLVNFDLEDYDIGSDFDTVNHKLIIPKTGYYLLNGQLALHPIKFEKVAQCLLFNNGTNILRNTQYNSIEGGIIYSGTPTIQYLSASDEITVKTWHNNGDNVPDIMSDQRDTFFEVHLLSI